MIFAVRYGSLKFIFWLLYFFLTCESVNLIKMFKVKVAIETSYTRSRAWCLQDGDGYTREENWHSFFFFPTTNCFTDDPVNIAFIFKNSFPCIALISELFYNSEKDSAIKSHVLSLKCTSWCSKSAIFITQLESGERPGWTSSELFRGEVVAEGRCCENGYIMKQQISFRTAWGVSCLPLKFHTRCHSSNVTSVYCLIHTYASFSPSLNLHTNFKFECKTK